VTATVVAYDPMKRPTAIALAAALQGRPLKDGDEALFRAVGRLEWEHDLLRSALLDVATWLDGGADSEPMNGPNAAMGRGVAEDAFGLRVRAALLVAKART